MDIRKATAEEYEKVRDFYYEMIDHIGELEYTSEWKKGIYPTDEYLEDSIHKGELYIGVQEDKIRSAMILNTHGNDSYETGNWSVQCDPGEYEVIHVLGVMPSHTRKGYAKEMIKFALDHAKNVGMKALRLDVLKGNRAAENLYPATGFARTDELRMFYEDTGWTDFILYDYVF